jgi:hypothetical protein
LSILPSPPFTNTITFSDVSGPLSLLATLLKGTGDRYLAFETEDGVDDVKLPEWFDIRKMEEQTGHELTVDDG